MAKVEELKVTNVGIELVPVSIAVAVKVSPDVPWVPGSV